MQILRFICIFSEKSDILSFELCFEPAVLKTLSRDHCPLLSVSHLLTKSPLCSCLCPCKQSEVSLKFLTTVSFTNVNFVWADSTTGCTDSQCFLGRTLRSEGAAVSAFSFMSVPGQPKRNRWFFLKNW